MEKVMQKLEDEVIVLMSTYNGEKYLKTQIDSILSQEGCQIRLVVRDDGSKDRTLDILEEYASKGKLEYYQGKNAGPARSFMELIKKAPDGQFYAFADQDDKWLPDKMICGITNLKGKTKPAVYASNMSIMDDDLNLIEDVGLPNDVHTDFTSVMTSSGRLFGCTMMFNGAMVDFIKSHDDPQYIVMHDVWLCMIAALYDNLCYDSNPHMYYRRHRESVTYSKEIPLSKKIRGILKGSKEKIPKQCKSFVENIGSTEIEKQGKWEICDLLMNYKNSIHKKVKLSRIIWYKTDMSARLRGARILQIILSTY